MNESETLVLAKEPIGKLLKSYALPAIIAMTASSLYNMVDSIYIGKIGPLAISGLAVTFPFMNLSAAFGTLVGVGASTMLSILLGQKNYKQANNVLGNIFSLNVIIGLIFAVLSLIYLEPILRFFGASDNTLPYASQYMKIILYGNIITHLYFGLNSAMRSSGFPKKAMYLTLFTVILNALLDPIMIFSMGMGIKGAALATIVCQFISFLIVMGHFLNQKRELHFKTGIFRLKWRIAIDSMTIGFGPFLMNSAACLVVLFINQQMYRYNGDLGIGAYGICNRITFVFSMICMGLNQGMQPIAGYNYGAKMYSRVKQVYNMTLVVASAVLLVANILCVFTPSFFVSIFTSDRELSAMASHGLRIMNCDIVFIGYYIVTTNLFLSLGMVSKSIFLSLLRQLIYLVPLIYALPLFLKGDGVWWTFPIADALSFVTAIIMGRALLRKFSKLKDGDNIKIFNNLEA